MREEQERERAGIFHPLLKVSVTTIQTLIIPQCPSLRATNSNPSIQAWK